MARNANGHQAADKLSDDTALETSVYDCAGQRVQTTAGTVTRTMVYDILGQDVADYSSGAIERENIYRGGQLLATQEFPSTQNVVWTSATGVTVSGNSITKSGTTGWGYSGAVSTQAIVPARSSLVTIICRSAKRSARVSVYAVARKATAPPTPTGRSME